VDILTQRIETDVLIIGGGLSGCMAAINAAEHGARVAIMEKSHTERSGAAGTGNDHFWFYDPEIHGKRGWTIPDMVRDISFDGEYGKTKGGLMDQELLEIIAAGTKEAVDNLESWGVQFKYDKIYPWNLQYDAPEGEKRYRIVPQFQSEWDTLNYDGRDIKKRLTEQCLKRGVEIFNRVAGTGLLTRDGKVVGVTGVHMRTGEFHVFSAKAVIMATGMDQTRLFRAQSGDWFNQQSPPYITGDGEAMALRAGAEVFILQEEQRHSHHLLPRGAIREQRGGGHDQVPCRQGTPPEAEGERGAEHHRGQDPLLPRLDRCHRGRDTVRRVELRERGALLGDPGDQ
jgi:adenylylsulfate reductase subunit A